MRRNCEPASKRVAINIFQKFSNALDDEVLQHKTLNLTGLYSQNSVQWVVQFLYQGTVSIVEQIKGIRDAGSTADFRILFEILKFKNLKN